MDPVPPLGPRPFDLHRLSDQEFEELCFRLVRIEAPGASATANPDGGADALMRSPGGGFGRAWQAKHHTSGISWSKCRESLDRVVEVFGVEWVTFCFPVDLTKDLHLRFDAELCRRHSGVRVDSWDASDLQARLAVSKEGQRVARHYFGDPSAAPELITRAIRAGGNLASVEDAIERLRPIGEFLDGHDPFFVYPHYQYPNGEGPPPAPGSVISLEQSDGQRTVRIDAVPRDAEAAQRFRPILKVVFDGDDGDAERRRLDDALMRNQPVTISQGINATWTQLPPAFGDAVGKPFAAEISIQPNRDPWLAEFRVLVDGDAQTAQVKMDPVDEPQAGWDIAFEGHLGGLCISLLARLGEGQEWIAINWTHRLDGSPAREQLRALRLIAAVHEEGDLIVRECEQGIQLMRARNERLAINERLPRLISLLSDLVEIEDWIGSDIAVASEITGQEIETISAVAEAIRTGRSPFRGEGFELVGDAAAAPELLAARIGAKVEIGETWVVEIFGQGRCLGRRTVCFPLAGVSDQGEVEPGRHAFDIELDPSEDLYWELEPPDRSHLAEAAA